jgi:hypothetical protein
MTDNNNSSNNDVLAKDMRTRGCPACDHIWKNVYEFFSHWVYVLANDEAIQNADALGLCPFHTWQLLAIGSPRGISKGYVKLIKRIADKLLELSCCSGKAPENLAALIKDSRECRICTLMRDTETVYLKRLVKFMAFEENRRLYATSQGLCLRHLGFLVAEISDAEIVRFLLTEASRHFGEVAEDMENYSLKHETLQRYLLNRKEKDAYLRAAIHTASGQNIVILNSNKL